MKKSIFILTALFAATFANAQITLEHTETLPMDQFYVHYPNLSGAMDPAFSLLGDFLYLSNRNTGENSLLDLQTYSTTVFPTIPANGEWWHIAKGYFTSDNRICYTLWTSTDALKETDNYEHLYLYDIQGNLLQDLGGGRYISCGFIPLHNGQLKFYIARSYMDNTTDLEIYSLPGDGEATAVTTPSSPKRSARKITRNGQVLVQTDNNTYTLTGAEIK